MEGTFVKFLKYFRWTMMEPENDENLITWSMIMQRRELIDHKLIRSQTQSILMTSYMSCSLIGHRLGWKWEDVVHESKENTKEASHFSAWQSLCFTSHLQGQKYWLLMGNMYWLLAKQSTSLSCFVVCRT